MVPTPLSPGNLDSHFLCQNRQASADQTVNADALLRRLSRQGTMQLRRDAKR